MIVVAPPDWEEPAILLAEEVGASKVAACVTGGETRSDSVRAGVAEVPEEAAVILVHDAARPLVDARSCERLIEALARLRRRRADAAGDRHRQARSAAASSRRRSFASELVTVQTPQAFVAAVLRAALD